MFLLLFAAVGIGLGLARGGTLLGLGRISMRFSWLVPLALALQVMAFSSIGRDWAPTTITALHFLSYALIVVCLAANSRLSGFPLVGAGVSCNVLALGANGGKMPTPPEHLAYLGVTEPVMNNSISAVGDSPLWWLGDVFLFPIPPLTNVFSVGDVLIGLGVLYFCYRTVRSGRPMSLSSGDSLS